MMWNAQSAPPVNCVTNQDAPVFHAIATDRLILRRLVPDDADAMFEYHSDPNVARYQDRSADSIEQFRESIRRLSEVELDTPESWFQLAIVHRVNNTILGDCGLHFFSNETRQSEIGITLAPAYHRQGYATEAVRAILELLFIDLGKDRVYVSMDPGNDTSISLFQRVGMRKEAHFVKSLWFKGVWVDDLIYAITEPEWKSLRS
jgi:RimJ/RimL family protein N-acetyltransferase